MCCNFLQMHQMLFGCGGAKNSIVIIIAVVFITLIDFT